MSNKEFVLLDAPCPICPRLVLRKVSVNREDVENERLLSVFSPTCGHVWTLPADTAARMKPALSNSPVAVANAVATFVPATPPIPATNYPRTPKPMETVLLPLPPTRQGPSTSRQIVQEVLT
jgi:hypothetical protein